ncbi:MAG: polysaccharide biosynthesis/export family protein [Gemmatimonadaceae bacterium]
MSALTNVFIGRLAGGAAAGLLCLLAASGARAQAPPLETGARAVPSGMRATVAAPAAGDALLRPGDHVRVTVWRSPELSGEFAVGADGRLQHPFYNDIMAVGVTAETLREHIRLRLATMEQNPEFLVEPLLRVAVGGEVRTPSLFNVAPGTTVADVVLLGGGVTESGGMDKVKLFRDGRERSVDLRRANEGQALLVVESGDQVIVGTKKSFFRDYVVPASSLVGALGWVVTLIVRR